MYMFFWFFKQLYYSLRRIFKSGILLLIVFFIAFLFIFVKPSFASVYIPDEVLQKNETVDIYEHNNVILRSKTNYDTYIILYSSPNPSSSNSVSKLKNGTWTYRKHKVSSRIYIGFTNPAWDFSRSVKTTDNGITWDSPQIWESSSNSICLFNLNDYDIVWAKNDVKVYNIDGFQNGDIIFHATITPAIQNNSSSIIDFSFTYLTINAYSLSYDDYYELRYTYPDVNTIHIGSINDYKSIDNAQLVFNIPRTFFTNDNVIRSGSRISFDLIRYHRQEPSVTEEDYSLGSYILDLTSQEQEVINEDSNKQVLSDISNNQKETTQAVENLENTITNSNIDDSSINLPTDNSNDITQEGLNGIFTSIYNAFCVGEPQDIVFPIPFTNKNITLQPNYVRSMLTSSGATWIITIIEAFWWYLISRFIIKDITNKITKIKSGNIENIENSNIKGDML